jgi:hypothetical protein
VLVARNPAALSSAAADFFFNDAATAGIYTQDLAAPDLRPFLGQLLGAHDIGLVVCNAGATHGVGAFLDEPLEKALSLVRLNCLTPVTVALQALARRRGLIIVSRCQRCAARGFGDDLRGPRRSRSRCGRHWNSREGIGPRAVAGAPTRPRALGPVVHCGAARSSCR